jgi:serine/threonine-protein kinase
MPTGQMQAFAGDWPTEHASDRPTNVAPTGDWSAPASQATPPMGSRLPTGTHAVVQNLPPPPPLQPPLAPPGPAAHPLVQTGPHALQPHPTGQPQPPAPAPQGPAMQGHGAGRYPAGHGLTSAAVATTMPGGTVAAHQTGPHSMVVSSVASSPAGLIPFPVPGATLTSSRGTYVVGQLIGDGQYGSVYECVGPFDQLYALKMLRPSNKPYQAVKDEWVLEMQRLESFRHPNIVYIHDAFEDNYLFYLALERCDTSLRALSRAPLPDPLFLEITRQLLMALAYLHDNGLVHSDLHAGNVLISQLETHPIVKLTDFGVAHQLDGSTHWYRPQVANPKIIAPELLTAGYTTRQSDLYQLGLLMFQMHTGRPAIDVDNMQYGDTTRMIAEGTPRVLAEALSSRFSPVIAKLLRRRDAYRYQSAREVWEDLRLHARR